jgi:transketolase
MSSPLISQLQRSCCSVKQLLLNLHFKARSGHVGSALSCAEILTFLKFGCASKKDTIVLSKGHAASALYSVLAIAEEISAQDLIAMYYKDGSHFSAHPPPNKLPAIPFATGSLGHGPGLAAGLALGAKLKGSSQERVYCVMSDGELNEGSVWEAFAFAAHHKLSNLTFIVDKNDLQGFGRTAEVFNMSPLADKLRSFGIVVVEADGHDFESLASSYRFACDDARDMGAPSIILAKTTKGRGLPGLADTVDCHYLPMTTEVFEAAVQFCENELRRSLELHEEEDGHAS